MSKSLGNVVDPRSIVDGGPDKKAAPALGADVLRLWVASVDYSGDVLMGPTILGQVTDVYRKLRLTLRFLLGNLAGFEPGAHGVPLAALPAVDRLTLAQLAALLDDAAAAYDAFQFSRVYQARLAWRPRLSSLQKAAGACGRGGGARARRRCSALRWPTCPTGTWTSRRTACMCARRPRPTAAPARPSCTRSSRRARAPVGTGPTAASMGPG